MTTFEEAADKFIEEATASARAVPNYYFAVAAKCNPYIITELTVKSPYPPYGLQHRVYTVLEWKGGAMYTPLWFHEVERTRDDTIGSQYPQKYCAIPEPEPEPEPEPTLITCDTPTPHYATGRELLEHYDTDNNREIWSAELNAATYDHGKGYITTDEWRFVNDVTQHIIPFCSPVAAPFGDITHVTLDGKTLPEGGTIKWLLNDDARVKVFFKNTGNVASAFHIWVTDETGTTITGCDITTPEIPADGAEYFVDLCVFLPDVVKVKTLTAHIEP